jgi:RES domain-containing protein
MLVYRLAATRYINDLSGEGASINGSRWTPVGVPVVYASENRALASLEYYVHGQISLRIRSTQLATIDIPDSGYKCINTAALPGDWRAYPAPDDLQDIGAEWIKSGELILKVPSVLIPDEYNYILNAAHSGMKNVKISSAEDFVFDSRLLIVHMRQARFKDKKK